jgi:amino acid efflux transporter
MTGLKRQLTLKDGIALGIGSVMGSGVLFLPSLTYLTAGKDVLLSWIIATLFCVPLTMIFSELVGAVPNESGLDGFVELGLGRNVAAAVPVILLGTVCIGMPSAALIAGDYVSKYLGTGSQVSIVVALILIGIAIVANCLGAKTSSVFQKIVAGLFFILGGSLFFITVPQASAGYSQLVPEWKISPTLAGVVLAFWAFAGFENMTFLAGEFKNPRRDITVSIIVSVAACGALYLLLTANYASIIGLANVDPTTGLAQLAVASNIPRLSALLVTVLALGAVLINLTAWCWGISRLVFSSSGKGFLPSFLNKLDARAIPLRSLVFLLFVFCCVALLLGTHREFFSLGLRAVSSNFVMLYLLATVSYVKCARSRWKKAVGVSLSIALLVALWSSGLILIYSGGLFIVAWAISKRNNSDNRQQIDSPLAKNEVLK